MNKLKCFIFTVLSIIFGATSVFLLIFMIIGFATDEIAVGIGMLILLILCCIPFIFFARNATKLSNQHSSNLKIQSNIKQPINLKPQVVVTPKTYLTPNDFTFDEALNIYFNTNHDSCNSKYDYNSFFKSAFQCILNNIPKYPIILSNEKVLRNKEIDNPITEYKNITKSTPTSKLSRFVVIDTETTGLRAGGNDIIEICAIKFIDFLPTEKFHIYLKPRKPIPIEATNINHITNEMVTNAPKFSQIKSSLQNFIEGFPLVAHNAMFDIKFLHVSGLDLSSHEKMVYDTLALSRKTFHDLDNYKLGNLCLEQNIGIGNAHSATEDTLACAILFIDIIKQKHNVTSIQDL